MVLNTTQSISGTVFRMGGIQTHGNGSIFSSVLILMTTIASCSRITAEDEGRAGLLKNSLCRICNPRTPKPLSFSFFASFDSLRIYRNKCRSDNCNRLLTKELVNCVSCEKNYPNSC